MIEDFWSESREGDIHVRDSLQFELKSEFSINPNLEKNIYKQEFFLFIPSPLQIHSQTYSKGQFYLDQTNLIRYKTPTISLSALADGQNNRSPLTRLKMLSAMPDTPNRLDLISDELKLFGNIFKAAIRKRAFELSENIERAGKGQTKIDVKSIEQLCTHMAAICKLFRQIKNRATSQTSSQLIRHFRYTDEFISDAIDEYSLPLLKQLRQLEEPNPAEKNLKDIILQEMLYRKNHHLSPKTTKGHVLSNESILYRQGLLNRFMLEVLMLKSSRFSLEEKHGNILGGLAAGIAMFVYMVLFVWKISTFVINSFPFIMLAVVFYILKDRLKEGLKKIYYQQAYRWFPDYSTEIYSPTGFKVGHLTENFAFINSDQLPPDFLKIRNYRFHEELQALHRHESIIQYKREVTLYSPKKTTESIRDGLTTIFRLNIHNFLLRASNALQPNLALNPETQDIQERLLPKVYHLNIIIRNTYLQTNLTLKSEIKKFRVVVDKIGIKRVEQVYG